MAESEDRTEAPSAHRLQKARDDGKVALSREAMNFAVLLGGLVGIFGVLPSLVTTFVQTMRSLMANAGTVSMVQEGLLHATDHAINAGIGMAMPVCGTVMVLAFATGFLQSGFLIHPGSLLPKPERISPLSGLKRLLGGGTLPDTFKVVVKCGIFTAVLWHLSSTVIPTLRGMIGLEPGALLAAITRLGFSAAVAMVLAQLVIAGFDVFWTRFRHLSKLKMSREDLKDEYRSTEGDPHVKGRQKAMRAKIARQRMMEAVKTATVVVTNPTHYSVALVYEKGSGGAPRIVAKGMDDVAARIREVATDNRIPVVPNPPLARALFTLPLDTEVPAEHFRMVAAIIAYVWKLKQPAVPPSGPGTPP
ncbi:EscU/YscU/HrcU family type III secretion system export apparatus switch protein [Gluconobacter morbifer]|uniref:Flagellar biosynthetic protein FlhB n=1 Tax=Gluconobacter morbifer G707 TaxID=1088869 RepID=G6XFH8_9PROT|nr:EscU/YscU/HrcU family type III secretion system export apparatus switch protein [Gluconobacter morbifer]EHH68936.1 flagellar biosynthetic protein FlhB [Gluconobacter morbifer G707]